MENISFALYVFLKRTRLFCFFKQKTAYEMRISDWSSDVCSSDLISSMRQEIGGRVSGSGQFSHHFFLPLQDALDRWPFFHSRNVPGKIGKVLDISVDPVRGAFDLK